MNTIEIDKELERMTNVERLLLIEKATRLVRRTSRERSGSVEHSELKRSAEIMRGEYRSDKSLTELTVLDGEDFIDA